MLAWQPDAHFYLKIDTDVVLFPERLLRFLRTLEAAAGTKQGIQFGHWHPQPPFFQGHAYGFTRALMHNLRDSGNLSSEAWDDVSAEKGSRGAIPPRIRLSQSSLRESGRCRCTADSSWTKG